MLYLPVIDEFSSTREECIYASRSSVPIKRQTPNDDNDRLMPYKRHQSNTEQCLI